MRVARRLGKSGAADRPRHAAEDAGADVPAEAEAPDSSGGAHEEPGRDAPEVVRSEETPQSGALRGYTDQFEVLKMPRRKAT
jgi:HAE1 family hydrophobic/amphiphilic exporter-1